MSIHKIKGDGVGGHKCVKCGKFIVDPAEIEAEYCSGCRLMIRLQANKNRIDKTQNRIAAMKKFKQAKEALIKKQIGMEEI